MLRLQDSGLRLLREVPLSERVALHHDGPGRAVPRSKEAVAR